MTRRTDRKNETENGYESGFLACPECGGERFSWIIYQVQFGGVHRFENGHVDVEASKDGPITGSDIGEISSSLTELVSAFSPQSHPSSSAGGISPKVGELIPINLETRNINPAGLER
jgi:hypothetical protein